LLSNNLIFPREIRTYKANKAHKKETFPTLTALISEIILETMVPDLTFSPECSIQALNGGLFRTARPIVHPTRIIDSYELIFVRSGQLQLFEGEIEYDLGANQTLILSPGVRHGGTALYSQDLSFYWVHFLVARASSGTALTVPKASQLRDPARLAGYLHLFLDLQESQRGNLVALSHIILLCLNEIYISGLIDPKSPGTTSSLVERIEAFIATNYQKPITSSDVADYLKYNVDYLERIYRKGRKTTITNAINAKRIKEACAMLMLPEDRNINDIAFSCGFNNPGYFRRVFRVLTTMTPKMYRQLNAHLHINTH
jgi:AraC-like DNA-binding protein